MEIDRRTRPRIAQKTPAENVMATERRGYSDFMTYKQKGGKGELKMTMVYLTSHHITLCKTGGLAGWLLLGWVELIWLLFPSLLLKVQKVISILVHYYKAKQSNNVFQLSIHRWQGR